MWLLKAFKLTATHVGPQVYRGAHGGGARTVGGALTASSTFTSLWYPLFLFLFLTRVCVGIHRHTNAEWESVDYSDCSEENRAEQQKMGL